ncbi:NAD(P)/FAD-dependent oxidoreductase [Parasphingorhabdus halotolerans]|uniref:NAD(P)-binding protein n=1 Tax=Parasphingorhabdus halotolerans TaxID=2725558 RepID=A0A6H2DM63_9SPHN|nr:FAD-dependent oxidoreductase [Parasphingorhabdus halotolerans]QJB69470.1 NAD(P)-binding protein [Parasphingorhabdus halotolerans]
MKIAIIGSGLSGLACADHLVAEGFQISLFDKARGPGGRMSTRRIDTALGQVGFDHGAQYFTAREHAFQTGVKQWQNAGTVAPWPAAGPEAWVGVPAMNAPIKALAARHDVSWSMRIDGLVKQQNGWQLQCGDHVIVALFDAVVLAIPAEQAASLLQPWDTEFHTLARNTVSAPCWTLMLAFAHPVKTDKVIIRDDAVIGSAARNSVKPGRKGPDSWVIQASPDWSVNYLEDSQEQVVSALSDRFSDLLGVSLPDPLVASAHRWRYARSGKTDQSALYNDDLKIGVCGDWLIGPRVECAWLSGTALAKMIQG